LVSLGVDEFFSDGKLQEKQKHNCLLM